MFRCIYIIYQRSSVRDGFTFKFTTIMNTKNKYIYKYKFGGAFFGKGSSKIANNSFGGLGEIGKI